MERLNEQIVEQEELLASTRRDYEAVQMDMTRIQVMYQNYLIDLGKLISVSLESRIKFLFWIKFYVVSISIQSMVFGGDAIYVANRLKRLTRQDTSIFKFFKYVLAF